MHPNKGIIVTCGHPWCILTDRSWRLMFYAHTCSPFCVVLLVNPVIFNSEKCILILMNGICTFGYIGISGMWMNSVHCCFTLTKTPIQINLRSKWHLMQECWKLQRSVFQVDKSSRWISKFLKSATFDHTGRLPFFGPSPRKVSSLDDHKYVYEFKKAWPPFRKKNKYKHKYKDFITGYRYPSDILGSRLVFPPLFFLHPCRTSGILKHTLGWFCLFDPAFFLHFGEILIITPDILWGVNNSLAETATVACIWARLGIYFVNRGRIRCIRSRDSGQHCEEWKN